MKIAITGHALFEAKRRDISEELISWVVNDPQQKLRSKKERVIQNKYYDQSENKEMLLRIIGTEISGTFTVITVYKTSKISKYWIKEGYYESHF